jgi:DNA-binding MarR family transcriptional regulator/GNAT superfamily N-acetyltransferase
METGMAAQDLAHLVESVRRFNRFYAKHLALLQERRAGPFSSTEAALLHELARREQSTATTLGEQLRLDAGYLSRVLRRFQTRHLVTRSRSSRDGRESLLSLTRLGQKAEAEVNRDAQQAAGAVLNLLAEEDQIRLVGAMRTIVELLGQPPERRVPYLLRSPRPGDLGWVVQRHGALVAPDNGWDARYEAHVADVVARFVRDHDATRECCWIVERDGEPVGCVFLVQESPTAGRLRLLFVDPKARKVGIASRLVNECVRFARRAGYRMITISASGAPPGSRHLGDRLGFRLVGESWQENFGQRWVEQAWELPL